MSIKQLLNLLLKYKVWILTIPLTVAVLVFFLTQNLSRQYESKAMVFTNPTSNQGGTEGGMVRVDFYTSNNLFDNLTLLMKSRETLTAASLKLLSLHLSLAESDPEIILKKSFEELGEHISPALKKELSVPGNPDKTYEKLAKYHQEHPNSAIDYLIREHSHYAVPEILDHLFVARKSSSDMMEVSYKSDDPGVCYYTLQLILEAFMENYEYMKEQENTNSIKYFQDQLKVAQQKLIDSELNLKNFITSNQILNYYEQGKYLDLAKLEQDQDEERAKRLASGTKSNLELIENLFSGGSDKKSTLDTIASLQRILRLKQMELDGLKMSRSEVASILPISDEINTIKAKLEGITTTLFENSLSAQGVPRKSILDEWLRLKIQYEEQTQSIEVMQNRKVFINDKIDEFAPLGAELKKLEREVDVNENQYLSILNGLNVANLRKYELNMASSQKLIDEPYFPKKPLPSKRKFLVAGGFLGSGFMVISSILLFYFMDSSVKSAEKVCSLTKLPVAGGWPHEKFLSKGVLKSQLYKKLIKQFFNNIAPYTKGVGEKKIFLLYSLREGEGKTFLAHKFTEELLKSGASVSCLTPDGEGYHPQSPIYDIQFYDPQNGSWPNRQWQQLLGQAKGNNVVVEHPNIQSNHINYDLMNQANLIIFVVDASRNWSMSDKIHLENIQKVVNTPQVVWLNKMTEEGLEELNGEIPKNRNKARVFIKNLLT
jgi:uncharacterized protein involved in exopolysaccharide biosynthesis